MYVYLYEPICLYKYTHAQEHPVCTFHCCFFSGAQSPPLSSTSPSEVKVILDSHIESVYNVQNKNTYSFFDLELLYEPSYFFQP